LNAVIVLDKSGENKPVDVEIFYDPAETLTADIAKGVVVAVLDGITKKAFNVPELFHIKEKSVATESLSYINFLLPGVIGMSVMFSAMFGTAYPLVMEREKGILRRLRLTLLSPSTFIAAKSVGMAVIAFMQAAIILLTGVLIFDVKILGSLLDASLVVLIGCLMMVALGFFIAGISNRLESVDAISNSIGMPMMFLAGTFFTIDGAPDWLKSIAKVLPLTHLNNALRDILIKGKTFIDIHTMLFAMLAWTLVFLVLAVYFFKWELPPKKRTG